MTPLRIGIDIGSTTTKVVAVDPNGTVLRSSIEPSQPQLRLQSARMLATLRTDLAVPIDLSPVVATGYGRKLIQDARKVVTEISCHARGAFHLMKCSGVLIDIGGQDTKVIQIGPAGEVLDFAMNDKCAAGTGRFLEVILARLGVPWDDVALMVRRAQQPATISSTCTVFAESEVISLIANGQSLDSIVKGLHWALSDRIAALGARHWQDASEVMISGGVARNEAMVLALSHRLHRSIRVLPQAQLVGALGAALSI